jgi:alanine racemase
MDMLTVDLNHAPEAGVGTEVTLWGQGPMVDGRMNLLHIDEVAHHSGTIGYELMCAVTQRVPFEVLSPHQA